MGPSQLANGTTYSCPGTVAELQEIILVKGRCGGSFRSPHSGHAVTGGCALLDGRAADEKPTHVHRSHILTITAVQRH
jgi:hypothetical protein